MEQNQNASPSPASSPSFTAGSTSSPATPAASPAFDPSKYVGKDVHDKLNSDFSSYRTAQEAKWKSVEGRLLPEPKPAKDENKRPDMKSYDYEKDPEAPYKFLTDMFGHLIKTHDTQRATENQNSRSTEENQQMLESVEADHQERMDKKFETNPGLQARLASAQINVPSEIGIVIKRSPMSADIVERLLDHPDETLQIQRLYKNGGMDAALRLVFRIEKEIESADELRKNPETSRRQFARPVPAPTGNRGGKTYDPAAIVRARRARQ